MSSIAKAWGAYLIPNSASQIILSFIAILSVYGFYKLFFLILAKINSPLRDLPGPSSKSFLYGNFKEVWEEGNMEQLHEKWIAEYGNTFAYTEFVGMKSLFTADLKAIGHVLTHNNDYPKPEAAVYNLRRLLGEGVFFVEGDIHRKQRKILNPAFGLPQIRQLTEIFVQKSVELRNVWMSKIRAEEQNEARLDAMSWFTRVTLDVIGLAGFDYEFHALSKDPENDELNQAFGALFTAGLNLEPIAILRGIFPILRIFPAPHDAAGRKARDVVFKIGAQLLETSKKKVHQKFGKERDLLSLLTRANMDPDLPESQRMSDEDVLSQIPTFLFAGHETTSTATTWALYALSQHKDIQSRLREELLSMSTDNPTMDDLNTLHYLGNVIKESLRLYAPLPGTLRVAVKDDIIPLSQPFRDKSGILRHEIRVVKGQALTIPILTVNRLKSLWGEDAMEFNPDRWDNLPEAVSSVPGVWGHMMTFLGGQRACIGYRFSLVEMKALLFTLIRAFEIDLAVPGEDITRKIGIVSRPVLVSDPANPHQLPIIIRPVAAN